MRDSCHNLHNNLASFLSNINIIQGLLAFRTADVQLIAENQDDYAGRECVSPEVNRNKNIGERGANMQRPVFRRYLSRMSWSRDPVRDWGDLSYLLLEHYDAHLLQQVAGAEQWQQPMNSRSLASGEKNKVNHCFYPHV